MFGFHCRNWVDIIKGKINKYLVFTIVGDKHFVKTLLQLQLGLKMFGELSWKNDSLRQCFGRKEHFRTITAVSTHSDWFLKWFTHHTQSFPPKNLVLLQFFVQSLVNVCRVINLVWTIFFCNDVVQGTLVFPSPPVSYLRQDLYEEVFG